MPKVCFTYPLLLLAIAFAMTACDANPDLDTEQRRYDMVTYMGYHDGEAAWQFIRPGDEGVDNMVATMDEPTDIRPGQRVLLSYSVETALPRITVWGYTYGNVASDSLRVNVKPVEEYAKHPIKLGALWRTGNYINLHAEVEYTGSPRWFYLLMDKATWNSDTVDCYLVHNTFGATKYFWRQTYASFYVGGAWKKQSCCALRVHINDNVFPDTKTYCFGKQ